MGVKIIYVESWKILNLKSKYEALGLKIVEDNGRLLCFSVNKRLLIIGSWFLTVEAAELGVKMIFVESWKIFKL